jgi:hypothetical protein
MATLGDHDPPGAVEARALDPNLAPSGHPGRVEVLPIRCPRRFCVRDAAGVVLEEPPAPRAVGGHEVQIGVL